MTLRYILSFLSAICTSSIISATTTDNTAYGNSEYFELMGKADIAIADKNWDEAEQYLLQAISTDPDNPSNVLILSNLGIVQYNLGRDSLALHSLNKAHQIAPKSVTVLSNRAEILLAMGRDSIANIDYAHIAQLDSTNIDAGYMNAMLSLRLGDKEQSQHQCNRLQHIAPDSIQTNIANASLLSATEQWEKAIPCYTKDMEKEPS